MKTPVQAFTDTLRGTPQGRYSRPSRHGRRRPPRHGHVRPRPAQTRKSARWTARCPSRGGSTACRPIPSSLSASTAIASSALRSPRSANLYRSSPRTRFDPLMGTPAPHPISTGVSNTRTIQPRAIPTPTPTCRRPTPRPLCPGAGEVTQDDPKSDVGQGAMRPVEFLPAAEGSKTTPTATNLPRTPMSPTTPPSNRTMGRNKGTARSQPRASSPSRNQQDKSTPPKPADRPARPRLRGSADSQSPQ